jgi:hypothetical protein
MADRLAELLRQRALLQEHLAWLDAEIAAASPLPGATPVARPPTAATPALAPAAARILSAATPPAATTVNPQSAFGTPVPVAPVSGGAGDDILEQYRVSDTSLKTDVRKGCLLYFAAAFALLGLGVAILWYAFRH